MNKEKYIAWARRQIGKRIFKTSRYTPHREGLIEDVSPKGVFRIRWASGLLSPCWQSFRFVGE